jgi:hypothetical protein
MVDVTKLALNTQFLMSLEADLGTFYRMGTRLSAHVVDGKFEGPRLNGRVIPGGGDWAAIRPDGTLALDVRATLETNDGAHIYMSYLGRNDAPRRLAGVDRSERAKLDPSNYYLRVLPTFETNSEGYTWLNDIVAVGVGQTTESGVAYAFYEIL